MFIRTEYMQEYMRAYYARKKKKINKRRREKYQLDVANQRKAHKAIK